MKHKLLFLFAFALLSTFTTNTISAQIPNNGNWCDHPLRPELSRLHEIKTKHPWFKVYDVGHNTYAIVEPYNWEETISYLIMGSNKALLFDTGMGLDSISCVVKELTDLPVWVLNSHTHEDHIGGNHEFSHILAMNTAYTRHNAANGYDHKYMQDEVSPASFCLNRLPNEDTAHYYIHPFKVTRYVNDGYIIDLGNRKIKVIRTPGHTPDAICLFDSQARYLWTGDSFYHGPIFLFDKNTNLHDYTKSIKIIARYARQSGCILPAHNLPVIKPAELLDAANAYAAIISGKKKSDADEDGILTYNFDKFSFKIGKQFLYKELSIRQ